MDYPELDAVEEFLGGPAVDFRCLINRYPFVGLHGARFPSVHRLVQIDVPLSAAVYVAFFATLPRTLSRYDLPSTRRCSLRAFFSDLLLADILLSR